MIAKEIATELTIDYLKSTSIYDGFQKVMEQLQMADETAYALATKDENDLLTTIRVGSSLALAMVKKIGQGKEIKDFTAEDWDEIVCSVANKAVLQDGQAYTIWVFTLYADYIDTSILVNKTIIKEEHQESIALLSKEIRSLTKKLEKGQIKETDYVEQCLWISFEAIVKLFVAYMTSPFSSEFGNLSLSVSELAIQYARLNMYKKENELLDLYLQDQAILDSQLQERYEEYLQAVKLLANEFDELMQDAFSVDFRERLVGSAELARKMGVSEDKVLDSVSKVDDFFG